MQNSIALPLIWVSSLAVAFVVGFQTSGPEGEERLASISGEASPNANDGRGVNRKLRSNRGVGERLSRRDRNTSTGSAKWESLAEQVVKSADPITRRYAFNKLLGELTPQNAADVYKRLTELGFSGNKRSAFNHAWGAISGQEAFDIAAQVSKEDLKTVIGGWVSTDPAGALAMLEGLPENLKGQRKDLDRSVIMALSANDLPLAVDLAEKFEDRYARFRINIMWDLGKEVIRSRGQEAAMVWADSLPDGTLKGQALNSIVHSLNAKDPQAAANWVVKFADQEYAKDAITNVSREWVKTDPDATQSWLQTLPEGNNRSEAFEFMAWRWQHIDPEAVATYLLEMPDSRDRDSAINGFVSGYGRKDPMTAIAWAEDISDPAIRQKTLKYAAGQYLLKNPREAMEWLPTSGLPVEMQQSILGQR